MSILLSGPEMDRVCILDTVDVSGESKIGPGQRG